ncbi:hypothetical protein [Pseudomonas migulae]|uniref:hypothetical protein n=1 Tax=Pseudomonas migulae TaxID=78543 RepID=UPI00209C8CF2|nr:hypothetical protein [Pseudomonas migulae]
MLLVIGVAPLYRWVLTRGTGPLIKSQAVGGESFSIDRRIYLLQTWGAGGVLAGLSALAVLNVLLVLMLIRLV